MIEYASPQERLKAEQAMGRKRNLITSIESMKVAICQMYGITAPCRLNYFPDSVEDWQVIVTIGDMELFESWRVFPSEELRAKLMLLGVMK